MLAGGIAVLTMAGGMAGCSPGRSVEAYCDVIAEHQDQYLTAMAEVTANEDLLAGISGMVTALGDLSRMWDEAAKVAPADIQTDVEAVRDAWTAQFEAAEEMASDPLGGLASSVRNAVTNAGAMQRVDEYTAESCPESGAMFSAAQAPAEPEPDPAEDPQEAEVPEPVDVIELQDRWQPFGPYMRSGFSEDAFGVGGPLTIYIAETGEVLLDAQALLPEEEVTTQEFAYGFDGADPFLAGLVEIRVPASGLEPERTFHSVLRVEPGAEPEVTARVDLDDPGSLSLAGSSASGIVTVVRDWHELPTRLETIAVDVSAEDVSWRRPGGVVNRFATSHVALDDTGSGVGDCHNGIYGGDSVVYAVDIRTGEELWRTEEAAGDCSGPEYEDVLGDRFALYRVDAERLESEVRDIGSGTAVWVPMTIDGVDPLSSLAWGYLHVEGMFGGGDFAVIDLATGDIHFTMARESAEALWFNPRALFDGLLYVTTTDEQLVVDARSGEELGSWTEHPVAPVGDHTWMSDDTLRLDWSPDEP